MPCPLLQDAMPCNACRMWPSEPNRVQCWPASVLPCARGTCWMLMHLGRLPVVPAECWCILAGCLRRDWLSGFPFRFWQGFAWLPNRWRRCPPVLSGSVGSTPLLLGLGRLASPLPLAPPLKSQRCTKLNSALAFLRAFQANESRQVQLGRPHQNRK